LKRWQFWLGMAISALFLWLALRGLELERFWDVLGDVNYAWLIPGIVVYFGAVGARTWRWRYMLRGLKVIPVRRLFPIVTISYMGNNVYPVRAGEVLSAYVLKRDEDVSMSASLATILVERIFDGLVLLLFVLLTLPTVPDLNPDLRRMVVLASLAFLGALAAFLALASAPVTARRLYGGLIGRFVPQRFRDRTLRLADLFMTGLVGMRHGRDLGMIALSSVMVWLLEVAHAWFVMQAFPFEVSFLTLMLMGGLANLALIIPAAPGGIGPFDWASIETLKLFGVEPTLASAYTLVLHVALWVPITFLGAYYFARKGLTWSAAQQAREIQETQL
jgi:glycosyltransferase 2 family protein